MTCLVTGWTENASIRNNASKGIVQSVADLHAIFLFPLVVFDSLGLHAQHPRRS